MSSVWTPVEPHTRFFIRFAPTWNPLRGTGFGLREPVMIGVAEAKLPARLDFKTLDAAIEQRTGETLPADIGGETNAAKLVSRAMFWVGAVQRHARVPVFGRATVSTRRTTPEGEIVSIAAPYINATATLTALRWVDRNFNIFLSKGHPFDGDPRAEEEWAGLAAALKEYSPAGVNIFRLLAAAQQLDVPARHLTAYVFSFGYGARGRWLASTYTDQTMAIAGEIAGNKFITGYFLRRAGLPAGRHELVTSSEQAIEVAQKIGYPVVVKPANRQQGRGVAANLETDAQVAEAFVAAREFSDQILVERHFDGIDHRMTVLNGRLLRVGARLPGGVIGDGAHTVAELVEIRRGEERSRRQARERGYERLTLDDEALGLLRQKGLESDYIPEKDEYIRLRRRGNVSAGATTTPIALDKVHPDNQRLAEEAAAAVRLDLAGIDIIFPDIAKSWIETGAHICEINAQPQMGARATPDFLLALMENRGRIPVVLVIGSATALKQDDLLREIRQPGMAVATSAGGWIGGEPVVGRQASAFDAAKALLDSLETKALTVLMTPGELRHFGLPADRCGVLILHAPDQWPEPLRQVGLFELALPSAERVIATQPADCLATLGGLQRRIEPASGSLLETCLQAMDSLLSASETGDEGGALDIAEFRPDDPDDDDDAPGPIE